MTKFHWFMEPDYKMKSMTNWEKCKYFFTARDQYKRAGKWHFFADAKSFLHVLWFGCFTLIIDLSNFFNKFNLGLPASHWLLGIRIWIVGIYAILGGTDYYNYIVKRKGYSMGINIWLAHCIVIIEALLFWKHLDVSTLDNAMPTHVKAIWGLFFGFCGLICLYMTIEDHFIAKEKLSLKEREKEADRDNAN